METFLNELAGTPNLIWILFCSYLLGGVPFGLLIAKFFLNYDIRSKGSGNIGMTNVMRTGGKLPGIATFVLDFGKGVLAVVLAGGCFDAPESAVLVAGFLAVFGHCFSVFLKFKGGKGVATGFGVIAALDWRVCLLTAGVWLAVFLWKKIASLSSLIALGVFPLISWWFYGISAMFFFACVLSAQIFFTHRQNLERLMAGKEGKLI